MQEKDSLNTHSLDISEFYKRKMEERGSVACCQRVPWRIHNHWVCEVDFLRRHVSRVGSVGRHFDLVTNLPLCE